MRSEVAPRGSLARVLRLLELEEEQAQRTLQSALRAVEQWRGAQEEARERERRGRRWLAAHAASSEAADRVAGLEEVRVAGRMAREFAKRLAAAECEAAERRREYLAKRIERRQAETLVEQAAAREAKADAHRAQQGADDWYLGQWDDRAADQLEHAQLQRREDDAAVPEPE